MISRTKFNNSNSNRFIPANIKQCAQQNWPRIMGLMQADGNFNFFYDSDGTFRPRAIITITHKRPEYIAQIVQFLQTEGFKPRVEPKDYAKAALNNRGVNIVIERQTECARLFEIFDAQGCMFVDSKLCDYLTVKNAFETHRQLQLAKQNKQDPSKIKALKERIVSLKLLLNERAGPKQQPLEVIAQRLALTSDINPVDKARTQAEMRNLAEQQSLALYKKVENQEYSHDFCYFIAGLWDGDGSFQVNFITHVDKTTGGPQIVAARKGKSAWARPLYEIKPIITLTNEKTHLSQAYLYRICSVLFENKKDPSLYNPGKQADRYVVNSLDAQLKIVIPFFEAYGCGHETILNRFRIYKLVCRNVKYVRKRVKRDVKIIKCIYNSPYFDTRDRKPLQELLAIVAQHYKLARP